MLYFQKPNSGPTKLTEFFHVIIFKFVCCLIKVLHWKHASKFALFCTVKLNPYSS